MFWTEVGAYTLSNVLDGYTTVAHPEGYEEAGFPQGSAFLLGQHPTAARYVATMGALQGLRHSRPTGCSTARSDS